LPTTNESAGSDLTVINFCGVTSRGFSDFKIVGVTSRVFPAFGSDFKMVGGKGFRLVKEKKILTNKWYYVYSPNNVSPKLT
jgi:hypothetical protein